jgi:hypothetical protein
MEFVPDAADTGESNDVLHLRSEDGLWTFRRGERWSDATVQGEYATELNDEGFFVGQSQVLPHRLEEGETSEHGVTVVALGELEVWYGTFPMVARVEVTEGLPGEHAFAESVGPVRLELVDMVWELAYYE